jgi:hypothetical protein
MTQMRMFNAIVFATCLFLCANGQSTPSSRLQYAVAAGQSFRLVIFSLKTVAPR